MNPDANSDCGPRAEKPPAILRTSVIYQRLEAIGMCGRVRCYFLHKTDGSAGSLIVDDRAGFVEELLATGRFCRDSHGGAMLHGGMMSLRETSPDANQALHFSFGTGDYVWVHTDSVWPHAGSKVDGKCHYERWRTARHIRRDVLHVRRDLEALLFGPRKQTRRQTRPAVGLSGHI